LVFITFASFHCERDPALGCLAVIHMHAPQEAHEGDALVAPETKDGTVMKLAFMALRFLVDLQDGD